MTATPAATMRQVVLRYFTCLDTEDWDGMTEIWAPNGVLRAVGARPRDDREGVIGFFSKLFDPWPVHRDRPERLIVSEEDQTVVAEVVFTGTTPDGRDVRFEAIDLFDFEEGLIRRLTNWYDIDYARKALQPPSSGSAR